MRSDWVEHDGRGRPVPPGTIVDIRHFNGDVTHDFVVGGATTFAPDGTVIELSRARWSGWEFHDGGPMGPKFRAYRVKGEPAGQRLQSEILRQPLCQTAEA